MIGAGVDDMGSKACLGEGMPENMRLIEPVGYPNRRMAVGGAERMLAGYGGVRKGACVRGVPCVALKGETGWAWTVGDGWDVLVRVDGERVVEMAGGFGSGGEQRNVFGRGDASDKIVEVVKEIGGLNT